MYGKWDTYYAVDACKDDDIYFHFSPWSDNEPADNKRGKPTLDNSNSSKEGGNPAEGLVNRRQVTVKRHKSFNNDTKPLDNRQTLFATDFYPNLNKMRPTDVLKTPYLLATHSSQNVGNFPQINSTSMVAKTKAMFEEKDSNSNFVPLGKSRTFSSFPSGNDNDVVRFPLTPSVPQRNSSRKVFANYKSMNANMNHCGMESGDSSPAMERRIPVRNFF